MAACRISMGFAFATIERRRVGGVFDTKFDRAERSSYAGRIDFAFPAARSHWIVDIAYACGFDSTATFYRAFRSVLGLSPGDLRQR